MNLDVVSVGTRMPSWLSEGWQTYARRMPPHLPLRLLQVDSAPPQSAKAATEEALKLNKNCPERATRVALNGGSHAWSTEVLAQHLERWMASGDGVCFFIGGADGLDATLIQQADHVWSLGPAVFPHMMVRVLVAEQLYRAWTILQGHPYHRGE